MTFKIKNFLALSGALLILAIFSILLHELIHVIQFYFIYGIPLENMQLHFVWEFDGSGMTPIEQLINIPAAWISFQTFTPITAKESLFLEIPAYTIQYAFLIAVYLKFMNNNDDFKWN